MEKKPNSTILFFLMALAPIGALIFIPGLPEIAAYFSISLSKAQWVMTIYLLGYSLGMLFYGPIANAFGRKSSLYIGLVLAILGALFCGLSKHLNSFLLLIVSRLLMSFGASCGYTITFTIIGDYYKKRARKMIAVISFGALVLPYLAVVLGGFLVQHFGWEMPFYVMTLLSLLLLISSIALPETAPLLDKGALNFFRIVEKYYSIIKVPGFLLFTLIAGSQVGLYYLFGTLSSILGIEVIKMSPRHFGALNLLTCLGFAVGNPLTALLAHWRLSFFKVMFLGVIVVLASSFLYFIFFLLGYVNVWTLFSPAPLLTMGIVLIWATGASQAIEKEEDKANASSLMAFLTSFIALITVFISGIFNLKHPLLMPTFFLAALSIVVINMFVIKAGKNRI